MNWSPIFGLFDHSAEKVLEGHKGSIPTYRFDMLGLPYTYLPEKTLDGEKGHAAPYLSGGLDVISGEDPTTDPPKVVPHGGTPSAWSAMQSGLSPQTFDFLNADLAKYYGMSRETAYQEALANTSYQRAVKDMQSAGLNPAAIFGSGKGSGADSVSYIKSASPSGGSGGRRSGGASAKSEYLFSESMYNALPTLVGAAAALGSKNWFAFYPAQQAAKSVMQSINGLTK